MEPLILAGAIGVTLLASFVKGAVGFAMPMIMISGLASFLPPETALAALILPTLFTNLAQAFRQGARAAAATTRAYWRLIAATCAMILVSAQLVLVLPGPVLLISLGIPIVAFALSQLLGWQFRFHPSNRARAEVATGLVGGFYGGFSGIWGPPTVALLSSLGVPREENLRVQGVVYLLGSVFLAAAHLWSGVLNAGTLPLSAALVLPSAIGLWAGFRAGDRMDAARFRRWTMVVLLITGLNLIRRALVS